MVKVSELFDCKVGASIDLCHVETPVNDEQLFPYVSRTEKNNGISAWIGKQEISLCQGNTLSVALVGNSVLETFYQRKPYYVSQNMYVLSPKNPMTEEEMLFYAVCIRANRVRYSYGRPAHKSISDIPLPDRHEIPAWIYSVKRGQVQYQPANVSIDLSQWVDIALTDVFDIERGKSEPISEMTLEAGNTPIISSSDQNNGLTAYTNYDPTITMPCITLAVNGSVGASFYQDKPFIATADVVILKPKMQLTKNIAVYITTLLRAEGKTKYSYGRKWSLENLKKTMIKLPVKDGIIDWQTIEDYMKAIENQFTIKWNILDFKIAA